MLMFIALEWRSPSAIKRPKVGRECASLGRAHLLIKVRPNPHG